MAFLKNLFKKNKIEETYEENDWDKVQFGRESMNFKDPKVREQYVKNCLDQMKEASDEIDRINAEYGEVTSYLTDMEEIEALKGAEKERIANIAKRIHDLRKAHDNYIKTPSLITEAQYERMEALQDEVPEAVKKLKEEEEYREKVRNDLMRISREKKAYEYRKHECSNAIENSRGIVTITIGSFGVLMVILFLMQMLLSFDVKIGYYMSVAIAAIALTVIYIRYMDAVNEKKRIANTINEIILLENKVKIRYVNNRNLLDYLYLKFGTTSSSELSTVYDNYLKECEERKRFERNEVAYADEVERLVMALKKLHIHDPQIWIFQSDALYDSREMVEIRHGLIGRRQKLRKQLEYNENIALEASAEVKGVIKDYPDYAAEVLAMVDLYEKEK